MIRKIGGFYMVGRVLTTTDPVELQPLEYELWEICHDRNTSWFRKLRRITMRIRLNRKWVYFVYGRFPSQEVSFKEECWDSLDPKNVEIPHSVVAARFQIQGIKISLYDLHLSLNTWPRALPPCINDELPIEIQSRLAKFSSRGVHNHSVSFVYTSTFSKRWWLWKWPAVIHRWSLLDIDLGNK